MNDLLLKYAFGFLTGVFISSVSQILLKKSALKTYDSRIMEYLNPLVIIAYIAFIASTFITIFAYKYIPLSLGPILETFGYVFVTLLGAIVLKEKISKKKLLGMAIIIVGTLIFAL